MRRSSAHCLDCSMDTGAFQVMRLNVPHRPARSSAYPMETCLMSTASILYWISCPSIIFLFYLSNDFHFRQANVSSSVESSGSEKKDQMTSSCSPLESRQNIDRCSNVSLKRYQIGFLWSVTFDHVINQCMTFSRNEHEALCVCFTIEIVKWDDLSM